MLPHDLSNVDSGEHLAQDPKLKELRSTDQHTYTCVLIASHCVCCPLAQVLRLPVREEPEVDRGCLLRERLLLSNRGLHNSTYSSVR